MYWTDVLLIFILSSTLFVSSASGQRELDMEVYGDAVIKTDIRTYTIYSNSNDNREKSVIVRCSISLTSVASTLLLSKNSKTLNKASINEYNTQNTAFKTIRYNSNNVSSVAGAYLCRINFTTADSGDSVFSYSLVTKLNIEVTNIPICASDIGYSGYSGENAVLGCEGNYPSSPYDRYISYEFSCGGVWITKSRFQQPLQILFNHSMFRFNCLQYMYGYYGWQMQTLCQSQPFNLYNSLRLEISQIHNDTANLSSIEFTCKSTPPRLIYWEVFGEDGNILNLYQLNQLSHINAHITIQQSAGFTSIIISGPVILENRINVVICSTYDTEARAVAYASLRIRNQTEYCESTCTCPSNAQTTEEKQSTTIMYGDTFTATQGKLTELVNGFNSQTTPMPQATPLSNGAQIAKEEEQSTPMPQAATPLSDGIQIAKEEEQVNSNHFLVGALCLLLIIILGMTVTIFYLIYRLKKFSQIKGDVTPATVYPPETELHDNPVYLPFSEPSSSSVPYYTDDEKERTYSNL